MWLTANLWCRHRNHQPCFDYSIHSGQNMWGGGKGEERGGGRGGEGGGRKGGGGEGGG